jgi:hypothetical protein
MRQSTRARAYVLGEYLSFEASRAKPDWRQIAADAEELAALARRAAQEQSK